MYLDCPSRSRLIGPGDERPGKEAPRDPLRLAAWAEQKRPRPETDRDLENRWEPNRRSAYLPMILGTFGAAIRCMVGSGPTRGEA